MRVGSRAAHRARRGSLRGPSRGGRAMLQRFTEIAPLTDWAILALSTACFVGGFLAYSHAQLAWRAFGERMDGPAGSGTVATMSRWAVALVAAGFVLWGVLLGWSVLVLVVLGALGAAALGVEAVVRAIG